MKIFGEPKIDYDIWPGLAFSTIPYAKTRLGQILLSLLPKKMQQLYAKNRILKRIKKNSKFELRDISKDSDGNIHVNIKRV